MIFKALFKIVMGILNPLHFHMNYKIRLSISSKKAPGGFIVIVLDIQINLRHIDILTILSLIPDHGCPSIFQFRCSVMSDSLRLHGLQHARPPCPSPSPGVHPSSCLLLQVNIFMFIGSVFLDAVSKYESPILTKNVAYLSDLFFFIAIKHESYEIYLFNLDGE